MTTCIVLLGFDVTHAVFTLTNYKPSRVVVILASVKGRQDPRASIAYNSLEQLANAIGARIEKVDVEVTNPVEAVARIRSTMEKAARISPLVIDLGGGLRLLVVETLIAYLSMPGDLRENSKIVIYVEGSNEAVTITPSQLRSVFLRKQVLSDIERSVLMVMNEFEQYSLDQIHKLVTASNLDVSKQYVYKILKKLIKEGYVEQVARGRYMRIK